MGRRVLGSWTYRHEEVGEGGVGVPLDPDVDAAAQPQLHELGEDLGLRVRVRVRGRGRGSSMSSEKTLA